jgi:transcriptional regulator with XRE-family HTH domain
MNLGKVLRSYRHHEEISLRALAKQIGISAPTLMRVERQMIHDTDAKTFMKILVWLTQTKL